MRKSLLRLMISIMGCMIITGCNGPESAKTEVPEPVMEKEDDNITPTETPVPDSPEPESSVQEDEKSPDSEEVIADKPSDMADNFYIHTFNSFDELLYLYKEAQDRHYTNDQIETIFGYGEPLLDHGWPKETSSYDVGYVYYDVNMDGTDELIITFDNKIVEIYSYFGDTIRRFYQTWHDRDVTLYPDGILKTYAPDTSEFPGTAWYSYDARLGSYFEDFEESRGEYYTYCHYDLSESDYEEIEAISRRNPDGDLPVWIYEWDDQLTKSQYDKLLPKSKPVKLPAGNKLADINLPDGYKTRYEANETSEEETIPEYFIYVKSPDGYANLRKGPGTEYDVICQIPTGDSMEVYRETARDQKGKKWLKVAYWHSEGTSLPDGTDDPGVWETGWISESQVE